MSDFDTELSDIAEIQTGYVFRGKVTETPDGNVQVIQSKNLADGRIDLNELSTVSIPDRGNQWRVHKGDILIRTRGNDIAVALVTEEPPRDTIAAAPLTLIRLTDTESADPAYVAWALAQPDTLAYLKSAARGTAITTISKTALARTPLLLPDIEEQRLAGEIATLSADIRRSTHRLAELEAAYINALLTPQ